MPVHVALLRGVNMLKHNRIRMQPLRDAFEQAGAKQVRTYIQSGNVVFRCDDAQACTQAAMAWLSDRHDLDVPVILRTAESMRRVAGAHPYAHTGTPPKRLHVGFLHDKPVPDAVEALAAPPGPDEFTIDGMELYLHFPEQVAKTKLTNAFFEKRLRTVCTMRNWTTVQRLDALCDELSAV